MFCLVDQVCLSMAPAFFIFLSILISFSFLFFSFLFSSSLLCTHLLYFGAQTKKNNGIKMKGQPARIRSSDSLIFLSNANSQNSTEKQLQIARFKFIFFFYNRKLTKKWLKKLTRFSFKLQTEQISRNGPTIDC